MDDFATVCQMYYPKVYRFLLSLSGDPRRAEDLTQEVFYRALLHIGQYRDDGHMFTWLCTIGKNCWISECRKEKRQVPLEQWNAVDEKGPEGAAAERERAQALRRAILDLPEDPRDVVILHVYGGVPLREIAARKGKSESWGKVTYYRARQMLKQRMEEFR